MRETMTTTLGQRIAQRLDDLEEPPIWLAGSLRVDQDTVRRWLKDINLPRFDQAVPIADLLEVNVRWLLTGEGDATGEPAAPSGDGPRRSPSDDRPSGGRPLPRRRPGADRPPSRG